jgi:alpha-glucosidase
MVSLSGSLPAVAAEQAAQSDSASLVVAAKGNTLTVTALTDQVLRVRIQRGGQPDEDASWAISADLRRSRAKVTLQPNGLATTSLRVSVDPQSLALTVTDAAGRAITRDAAQPLRTKDRAFTLRKAMPQTEHYFALGDKTGGLDRRGKSFVNWATDAYAFTDSTDPIYKAIPFFIGVGGPGGSYGLFLDNTWRSWFDFGHRDADIIEIGSNDGPIDYYIIAGPTTAEVVRRYTDLTGKAPMTPLWALGYQQSRYSYMTGQELRDVAQRLRKERVPTDVLWLDIDFQDRNRPFTVNDKTFPDLKGMIADLGRDGFKVVTITDPHIAKVAGEGYAPYEIGAAQDYFVHNPDGSTYVAPVWPGPSVFPDFTRAEVRRWWGNLYAKQMDDGVAGSWNDMNEPAIFETPTKTMPLDTVHRIDGDGRIARAASHSEIHNVYGMMNARGTYDGLRVLRPNERAFVMTRASYAGGQRYAATWTGDNKSTWDHLKLSIQQIINLGLSGFSWSAADVGGFAGGPSADLLTRWFEIGAFYPVFRDHSAKDSPRVEPWIDGADHLAIRRRYVEERYRLMPYLYALADQNARLGDPIMRPVFYDYPSALNSRCDQSIAFTLGRDLLVTPPPKLESPQSYLACLPTGGWYDYWTGKRAVSNMPAQHDRTVQSASQATGEMIVQEGIVIRETPRLDHLPVYVRAGAILPRQPLLQSTSETPQGPLELHVYPGADCQGTIYSDDGHSMDYAQGRFFRQTVRCTVDEHGLTLAFASAEGSFVPWWKEIKILVHDWSGDAAMAGHRALGTSRDGHAVSFILPARVPANVHLPR